MIKKNLKILIITSLVILIPIIAGVVLWDKLPEQIPMHWNSAGEVDGWSSKPFAVFAAPLILLALHWLCLCSTLNDPKNKNRSGKMINLVFWIIPLLSIMLSVLTYCTAMGKDMQVDVIVFVILGASFIFIGNYLPKCHQNYTIGIKIPWTLHSEENWNKTHRLAGWLWVFGGIAIIIAGFIGIWQISLAAAFIMALVPIIYSYILYRKGI